MSSWWVVLRQLSRPVLFWQPWWRAPLVFAGVELAYGIYDLTMTNLFSHNLGLMAGTWLLLPPVLSWIAGVVALRLIRPAEQCAPALEEV
jgi:hypothetical protein